MRAAAGNSAQDAWNGLNAKGLGAVTGVYLLVVRQPGGRKDVLRAALVD